MGVLDVHQVLDQRGVVYFREFNRFVRLEIWNSNNKKLVEDIGTVGDRSGDRLRPDEF